MKFLFKTISLRIIANYCELLQMIANYCKLLRIIGCHDTFCYSSPWSCPINQSINPKSLKNPVCVSRDLTEVLQTVLKLFEFVNFQLSLCICTLFHICSPAVSLPRQSYPPPLSVPDLLTVPDNLEFANFLRKSNCHLFSATRRPSD